MMAGVAQSSLAQTQTDEILVLKINLTAVSQSAVATSQNGIITDLQTNTITSADVIQALGASLGDTFSATAKLEVLAPTNGLDSWTFQIKDGSNPAVDVSGFFSHQMGYPSVGTAWVNSTTGQSGITDYSVDSFSLQDQGGYPVLSMHFSLSGFTAINSKAVLNKKGVVVGQTDSISIRASGTGDTQGNPAVFTGSIKAGGVGTETVVTAPPES